MDKDCLTEAQKVASEHYKELYAIMCRIALRTTGEKFTMHFPTGSLTFDIM